MIDYSRMGRLTTEIKGTQPARGVKGILEKYLEDCQDKDLLSFAEGIKKKSQNLEDVIVDILSTFNRSIEGHPIIGNWMFRSMLLNTADGIFNKKENKGHPSKKTLPIAIGLVKPLHINLYRNGEVITSSEFVHPCTVSLKDRSFFKAYETIREGAEFEVTMSFNENLISEDCIEQLLDYSQHVGLGAYRTRFGKFEWI